MSSYWAAERCPINRKGGRMSGSLSFFSLSIVSSISIIDSKKLMLIFLSRQVDRWAASEQTHIIKQQVLYSCKHSMSALQISLATSISTGLWVREYLHPTIYLISFSSRQNVWVYVSLTLWHLCVVVHASWGASCDLVALVNSLDGWGGDVLDGGDVQSSMLQ